MTIQKTAATTVLAIALGIGIYQILQGARTDSEIHALRHQQGQLTEKIQRLQHERDEMSRELASLRENTALQHRDTSELLRLRAEITRLKTETTPIHMDVETTAVLTSRFNRVRKLKQLQIRMPDKVIPELRLLSEADWLRLAMESLKNGGNEVNFEDDAVARLAFSSVRFRAKDILMQVLSKTLERYVETNSGQLPRNALDLKPYLVTTVFTGVGIKQIPEESIDDSVLERYEMLQTGKLSEVPNGVAIIAEKSPVDPQYDSRLEVGDGWMGIDESASAYANSVGMYLNGDSVKK